MIPSSMFSLLLLLLLPLSSPLKVPLPPLQMPPSLSQWQTDSIEVINDAVRGADDGEVNPFTLLTTAPTGTGKTLIGEKSATRGAK